MKVSELKSALEQVSELRFFLPNGTRVPAHFHLTEIGLLTKDFIDCGGTVRHEQTVSLQLWVANDTDHRLKPSSFLSIIELSKSLIPNQELELEVEYQENSISKFGLAFTGDSFLLTTKMTDCLAKDNCGIPAEKQKLSMASLGADSSCCSPGGGCC